MPHGAQVESGEGQGVVLASAQSRDLPRGVWIIPEEIPLDHSKETAALSPTPVRIAEDDLAAFGLPLHDQDRCVHRSFRILGT